MDFRVNVDSLLFLHEAVEILFASVVFQTLEYFLFVLIILCEFLEFGFYLCFSNECLFWTDSYHLLLVLPGDMLLYSGQLGFLVNDLSFYCRNLIGQFVGLSLHLPLNSLFDGNMFFPEMIQGPDAPAVDIIAGRFACFLELLTLSVDLLINCFNNSDGLGFKHLLHLHPDVAGQGFYLVRQPQGLLLRSVDAGSE